MKEAQPSFTPGSGGVKEARPSFTPGSGGQHRGQRSPGCGLKFAMQCACVYVSCHFAVPATLHAHCRLHARASEPAVCAAPNVLVVLLSVMYCGRRLLRALRAHACRGGNLFCACASRDTQYTRMRSSARGRNTDV